MIKKFIKIKIMEKICKSILYVVFINCFTLSAQFTTYTFTECGALGPIGPTQAQINAAYTGTNTLSGQVTTTNGIQQWTVPNSGLYRIQSWGAQGGCSGGLGAFAQGDFTLNAGQVLLIVAGQTGSIAPNQVGNGGGGGSYVVISPNTPLCIAGGGGGTAHNCSNGNYSNINGTITTSGLVGQFAQAGAGGIGGGGGGFSTSTGNNTPNGGGGGGFSGNGGTSGNAQGGMAFLNGSAGGSSTGGFGGGGGSNLFVYGCGSSPHGGCGGGGYSGGGAGGANCNGAGGGGGSFNIGTNQVNSSGVNTGNGKVVFTRLCSINIYANTPNAFGSICLGSSITLTTNAVSGILWSTGGTGTSVVVSPSVTTSYSVIGTSSANCVTSANMLITVQNSSISASSTTNSVCFNGTVALTGAGANTYTWSGGISNGVAFAPQATTIYTLTANNACGTYSTTQTITVSALPVVAISTSSAVCAGNVATLSAGGATTYTWMPGNLVGPNIIISPLATTIYTCTGTSGPCGGATNITVVANPNPTVTTTASNSLICAGAQVTLTAFGASTYTWQSGPTVSSSLVVSPTAPTAYQVSGTNSLGCTSNSTQVVIVNPSPIINVIASETLICAGGSSTLTASGGSNYTWNFGPTTASVVVSPTANTVYSVTSIGVGCNTTQTISVDVFTQTLTVSNSTAICLGSSVTLNASGGTTYLWSNGGTGSSIFVYPSVSTLYTVSAVTVINNMSCNSTGSVNLTINPNPTVTAVLTRSVICRGESTILTANGANTYVWNNTATTTSFVINPIINTNYTVTGTNLNGCKGTGTVQIKVNTCTGISELNNQNGLKIYPNPTNGDFTIESQVNINLELINELGQFVRLIKLSEVNNRKINISELSNGIYFLIGKKDNLKVKQKIIVTK